MELKTKLIELLKRAGEEEQALLGRLSEEECGLEGQADCWAFKDVIAHIAAWKEREVRNLELAARGESPVRHGDYEELNAQDFELYREMGWPDVLEKAAEATRQLVAQAEARSEEELEAESRPGRKLWQSIEGTGHSHSVVHLTEIYIKRGDIGLATQLRMDTVAELERLDDSPGWQGMVRYDLACHHALVGEKERAIEVLREALGLNPELTEWSKEDPDFAPLRDDPGYQALYTQRAGKGEDK